MIKNTKHQWGKVKEYFPKTLRFFFHPSRDANAFLLTFLKIYLCSKRLSQLYFVSHQQIFSLAVRNRRKIESTSLVFVLINGMEIVLCSQLLGFLMRKQLGARSSCHASVFLVCVHP